MVRGVIFGLVFTATAIVVPAQTALQKIINTEHAFARLAAEKGTKGAFLEYITDDGLLFLPDKISGRTYWNGRGESTGLLSWAPNYADISSDEVIGYTTGNWEYRPKGKGTEPTGFGEFMTIWMRQPDGKYKFVIDIGIAHPKPEKYSTDWTTTAHKPNAVTDKKDVSQSVKAFYKTTSTFDIVVSHAGFAAPDIRAFREGLTPFIGKPNFLTFLEGERAKGEKSKIAFGEKNTLVSSGDLAYSLNTYTATGPDGKVVEKGNTLQIFKLVDGYWKIVLDIFKPVP